MDQMKIHLGGRSEVMDKIVFSDKNGIFFYLSASGKEIQIHLYRWVRLNNSSGLDSVPLNILWFVFLGKNDIYSLTPSADEV